MFNIYHWRNVGLKYLLEESKSKFTPNGVAAQLPPFLV